MEGWRIAVHVNERQRNSKKRIKRACVVALGDRCIRCLNTFPDCCYDFHHLDPTIKDKKISGIMRLDIKKLWEELEKCILLCANCHRIVHYELNEGRYIKNGVEK